MRRNSRVDAEQLVPGFINSDVAGPALEDPTWGSSTRRLGLGDLQLQPAHVQQDGGSVGEAAAPHDDGQQTSDQNQLGAWVHQFLFPDEEHDHHSELIPPASIFDLAGMTKCSHGLATWKCKCALSSSTSDAGKIAEDHELCEEIAGFRSPGGNMSTNATSCSYTSKRKRHPEHEDLADPDSNQPEILDTRIGKTTEKGRSKPRLVREPRFAIKTRTNVDIMDDGFRWRKYGQKAVKDSPYPRNYYRCTTPHCPVRKRVERTLEDPGLVLTIYEGKHSHHINPAVTHQQPTNPGRQRSNLPSDSHQQSTILGRALMPLWPPSPHVQYHELQVAALQDTFNMLQAYQVFKSHQQEFLSTGFPQVGPLSNFPSGMPSSTHRYAQAAPHLLVPDLSVSLGNEPLFGPTVSGPVQPSALSEDYLLTGQFS